MSQIDLRSKFSIDVYENRRRLGFTQERLAEKAGISTKWLQKIEKGAKLPNLFLALILTDLLELDLNVFLQEARKKKEEKEK